MIGFSRESHSILYKLSLLFGNEYHKGWQTEVTRRVNRDKRNGYTAYGLNAISYAQNMVESLESEIEYYRHGELTPSGD